MLTAGVASLLLIAVTTLLHYEVLSLLYSALPGVRMPNRAKLLIVMYGAFVAHLLEIGIYGVTLYLLMRYLDIGRLSGALTSTLENCLYYSAETYTSLGFGDLVPRGPLRLLAGIEALNGLLLIGWSASFAYISMERFWQGDARPS